MRKTALPDDSSGQLTQSAWRNAWPPARGCFSCHRCSHTDPPGWHTPWQSQFCPCSQILKYRRAELLWIQRFKPFAILELCERRPLSVQPLIYTNYSYTANKRALKWRNAEWWPPHQAWGVLEDTGLCALSAAPDYGRKLPLTQLCIRLEHKDVRDKTRNLKQRDSFPPPKISRLYVVCGTEWLKSNPNIVISILFLK